MLRVGLDKRDKRLRALQTEEIRFQQNRPSKYEPSIATTTQDDLTWSWIALSDSTFARINVTIFFTAGSIGLLEVLMLSSEDVCRTSPDPGSVPLFIR